MIEEMHEQNNDAYVGQTAKDSGFSGKRWMFAAVVAALIVVVLGVYSINRIEESFEETVSDLLVTTLDSTVSRIERWERERVNDVRVLASSSDVVMATKNFLQLGSAGPLSPQASAARDFVESKIVPGLKAWGGVSYFIVSLNGSVIASTPGTQHSVRNEVSDNPELLNRVLGGETVMKFLPHEGEEGHYEIYVSAPIVDNRQAIAALVFELDPRGDFAEIVGLGRGRSTMETYAITPEGLMLSESRFTKDFYDIGLLEEGQESAFNIHVRDPGGNVTSGYRPKLQTSEMPLTKMAASVLNKENGINIHGYRDYRGVKVAGSWKWIDGLDIGVASEIDYDEAFSAMDELRLEIMILSVVSSLLIFGFAAYFYVSRRKMWESARRTRTVLDSALDGMIVINEKGIIETVNRAAVTMFGYTEGELIGRNVKMLMPEPYQSAHDGYLERYVGTGGRRIIGIGREVIGKRKDASEFPMDLAVAEMNLQGKRLFLGTTKDITERKEYESALLRSQETLKAAQRIAHLGSWSWEINTGKIEWSDEIYRIFGLDPTQFEATYENFMNSIHPDDREMVQNAVNTSLADKIPYSVEHRVIRPDGSLRQVLEQGELVFDERGNTVRMNGSVLDITIQKESERMKSEFVSTVSHELRTPLTSIHGSLGLLAGGAAGEISHGAKKLIDVAHSSSDRLIRLINDILDAEKLEAGKMVFNIVPHDIESLLTRAIIQNKGYGDKYNVQIIRTGAPLDEMVNVDTDRFDQVMANLLSNAIKFSKKGEKVEITTNVSDGMVSINVVDFGEGIPEEFHNRIFRHFTQADSSDTKQKGGTGLGLSISKSIVEYMGGSMTFVSQVGKGTTFSFTVPIYNDDHMEHGGVSENIVAPAKTGDVSDVGTITDKKVLISDSDNNIREFLVAALGKEMNVVSTSNPEELRGHLRQGDIGVVILGIDGKNSAELDLLNDIALMKNAPEIIIFTADESNIPNNIKVSDIMVKSRVTHDMIVSRVKKVMTVRG